MEKKMRQRKRKRDAHDYSYQKKYIFDKIKSLGKRKKSPIHIFFIYLLKDNDSNSSLSQFLF